MMCSRLAHHAILPTKTSLWFSWFTGMFPPLPSACFFLSSMYCCFSGFRCSVHAAGESFIAHLGPSSAHAFPV